MQFKLFTAFLLVAAYFVQVSVARPQEVIDFKHKSIIDDLLNKAKEIWESIQNVGVKQINKALELLNYYKDVVANAAESALELGKQKINKFIQKYQSKIDTIVVKAEEAGVDVQECVADNEQQFKILYNNVWEKEKRCVTKEVDDAHDMIERATDTIEGFMSTIQKLPDKLQECGTSIISSVPCITKVIAEVVSLQASLPDKIYDTVEEVAIFLAYLQPRLSTCADSVIIGSVGEAAQIVITVRGCVAKKMEEAVEGKQVSVVRSQEVGEVELRGIIDDLLNKAKEIWESIQNVVVTQINKALEVFNKYKDEVVHAAESALEAAKVKIEEFIQKYRGKIEEIVAIAKEAGVDVQECVADNEQQFKDLFNHVWENEKRCVTEEVDQAQYIIQDGINIVKGFMTTIQQIPGKLYECGTSITSIPCIGKVIAEAIQLQASLPLQIYNKVQEVVVFMFGLQPRLATCAISHINGAIGEATQIVSTVGECIAKKMEEAGNGEQIIDDMLKKAEEIIENLRKIINEQIHDAMEQFENYKGEAAEASEPVIEAGKKQFEELAQEYKVKADDIVAKAEEQGVDVQSCVSHSSNDLKILFDQASKYMKNCVALEVERAQIFIDGGTSTMNSFIAMMQDIPGKLQECGTSIASIPCLTKVVTEAAQLQSRLPSEISNKVQKIAGYMAELEPKLKTCIITEDTNVRADADEVLRELTECVDDKVGQ